MRRLLALSLAATVLACEDADNDDDARADRDPGMSADTAVIERTMQDTVIVTRDTTVRVDTTVRRGTQAVDVDSGANRR